MKSIISRAVAMIAITASILSFSSGAGGEGFEISLNGNVVLQRYGNSINSENDLALDRSSLNDQLTVRYHHCGKAGKNRVVSIRDWHNNILKEWRYADAAAEPGMNCSVKEIFAFQKAGTNVLRLYYSSSELPNGRLLTNIILRGSSYAKQ